jgi:oxygen-independent coproporphyrinogen-3 oxidase
MDSLGIYISVPFCKAKCSFCNFASGAIGASDFGLDRVDGYVERVCEEVQGATQRAAGLGALLPGLVDTIYLGGGTPSLLTAVQLERVFAAVREQFEVAAGAEVTLECAPGQLGEATLEAAVRLGVNRVSFGVQSFADAESAAVGRLHTAADCVAEIVRVRAAGISQISLDLIAGLPGQTAASWEISLAGVVSAGVEHASVYMLEVDEESRLGKELIVGGPRYGASTVPTDDAMTEMYARACEVFEAAGLGQYEISNFARTGGESKHNLKYWRREPYLGFGLDSHSMLACSSGKGEAVRFANADEMGKYMVGDGGSVTSVSEAEAAEERVFLGLRMNEGVPEDWVGDVSEMVRGRLMRRDKGQVMLTGNGRIVSNEVFGELLRVSV